MPQIKIDCTPEQYALLYAAISAMQTNTKEAYTLAVMESLFDLFPAIVEVQKDLDSIQQKVFGPTPVFPGTADFSEYHKFLDYFLHGTPAQRSQLVNEQQ